MRPHIYLLRCNNSGITWEVEETSRVWKQILPLKYFVAPLSYCCCCLESRSRKAFNEVLKEFPRRAHMSWDESEGERHLGS